MNLKSLIFLIHTKEKTLEWSKKGGIIQVKTNKQIYKCKKLVLTTGAWTSKFSDVKNLYENFLKISEQKYKEKREFEKLKTDVDTIKGDLDEIKSLLKSIVCD